VCLDDGAKNLSPTFVPNHNDSSPWGVGPTRDRSGRARRDRPGTRMPVWPDAQPSLDPSSAMARLRKRTADNAVTVLSLTR
jgi:hypothetical protein